MNHEHWMQLALTEARRGLGLTSPNPPVGAVIVSHDKVLATGWHRGAGLPHAEAEALAAVGAGRQLLLSQATLYITLEPCSTVGRTPACVDAILASGIRHVVWGADDPNPAHAGRAAGLLREAGCEVVTGVCRVEAELLITAFAKTMRTRRPWVIMKAGMSLDGRITRPEGEGQWLTSEQARLAAMQLRVEVDAIVVGAETVRRDNPALTIRGAQVPPGKMQPWRVVLSRSGDLPERGQVFRDAWKERTLVRCGVPLDEVMVELAGMGCCTVLIEGGGKVHAEALSVGLVDEVIFYIAPLLAGQGLPVVHGDFFAGGSVPLRYVSVVPVGPDLCVRALVVRAAEEPVVQEVAQSVWI